MQHLDKTFILMIGFPRAWQQQQASLKYGLLFGTLRRCNSTLGCARLVVPTVPGHIQRQDETGRPAEGLKTSDQHRPSVPLSLHTLKPPNQALACFNFLPHEWKVIAAPTPKTLPSHFPPSHCSELKARLKRIIFSPVIHSFIQSQRTWQSGWIIHKKKKKYKERTRLWTIGDASVLTPFQPPPILHSSQRTGYRHKNELVPGAKGGCTNQCPISPHHHHHPFSGPGTSWHPCPPFWDIDHRVQSYHLAKRLLFPRPKGFH